MRYQELINDVMVEIENRWYMLEPKSGDFAILMLFDDIIDMIIEERNDRDW